MRNGRIVCVRVCLFCLRGFGRYRLEYCWGVHPSLRAPVCPYGYLLEPRRDRGIVRRGSLLARVRKCMRQFESAEKSRTLRTRSRGFLLLDNRIVVGLRMFEDLARPHIQAGTTRPSCCCTFSVRPPLWVAGVNPSVRFPDTFFSIPVSLRLRGLASFEKPKLYSGALRWRSSGAPRTPSFLPLDGVGPVLSGQHERHTVATYNGSLVCCCSSAVQMMLFDCTVFRIRPWRAWYFLPGRGGR